MLAVTNAYFDVQQARGDLAAAQDATRRTQGNRPPCQFARSRTGARLGSSACTGRIGPPARDGNLRPRGLASERVGACPDFAAGRGLASRNPLSRRSLQVTLVEPDRTVDELITMGLSNRPELAADQALVQASAGPLRQEKLRPFIPSILLRGDSTPVGGTLGAGVYAGGNNGDLGSTAARSDWDLQVLWQLDNLGFGNVARARLRDSEHRAAVLELFRAQDRVAADVARAFAQAQQARRRVTIAERQVALAVDSYNKNLIGLGQVRRAGELVQTIVRPQEAIAAIQSLAQAYSDYFGPSRTAIGPNSDCTGQSGSPPRFLSSGWRTPSRLFPPPLSPPSPIGPSGPAAPPPAPAAERDGAAYRASFQMRDREP